MNIRQEMKELCACLCRQDELYAALARRQGLSYHTAMTLYALDQAVSYTHLRAHETD